MSSNPSWPRAAIEHKEALKTQRALRSELERLVDYWKGQFSQSEKRLDVALALDKHSSDKVPVIHPKRRRGSESVAFMIASDWHAEEVVEAKTVNSLNSYNLSTAAARVERFFQNGLRLIEIQRSGTEIDTLVLALLGDHMTGYIHEELVEGNELSPTETVLWLHARIISGIRYLLDQGGFKRILVPCAVGNHGRTTQKKRIATGYKNSYEWLMFHFLAKAFEGDSRVQFQIPQSYHNYVDVFGKTVRFHHGDSIRYQGGVGGITIPVNKAIAQWDKSRRADIDVFGHYHQLGFNRKWVSNGSLIGFNAYAVEIKADFEPPMQAFFLIEKDHGKTVQAPIMV